METSLKCEGLFGLLANSEGLERVSGLAFMLTVLPDSAGRLTIFRKDENGGDRVVATLFLSDGEVGSLRVHLGGG